MGPIFPGRRSPTRACPVRNGSFVAAGAVAGILFAALALPAADDAKDAKDAKDAAKKKPDPPRVLVVQPLGIEVGTLAKLRVRGTALTNATSVRLTGPGSNAPVVLGARGDAVKIEGFDAARVGDQRLEIEFTLPVGTDAGTNTALVVEGPNGASASFPLVVLPAGWVLGEKEPNNGFREAPGAKPPVNLRGALDNSGDVDVFRVELESGQTLHAEVLAARFGSTLDAMLTLYTGDGAVVASNDDAFGRDPSIDRKVAATGDYFVAVSYANEKAAATHEYVLQLRVR